MDLNAKLISKMELLQPKLVGQGLATTAKVNKEKGGGRGGLKQVCKSKICLPLLSRLAAGVNK